MATFTELRLNEQRFARIELDWILALQMGDWKYESYNFKKESLFKL